MSQASSLSDGAFLSVRIVTLDHYLAPPVPDVDATFSASRSHVVRRVPVLRIFGPTAAGQKVCLHLHGIFPYMYVPVPDPCPDGYSFRLALSLDRALNLSLNQPDSQQHVFRVQEVSGTPFYGYHPRQHRFFKIYFYNPAVVKRAAELLQNGGVMGARLQPHEAHVPYTLQFMMDYNLQGMNLIHLAGAKFRKRQPSEEDLMEKLKRGDGGEESQGQNSGSILMGSFSQDKWLDVSRLPPAKERRFDVEEMPEGLLMPEKVEPVASTELEADAVAADILNSNEGELAGMNPGLEALWEDERERRRLAGMEDVGLTPPDSPPRPAEADEPTESDRFWRERLLEKLARLREEDPSQFEDPGGSASSDPNATSNFFPGGSGGKSGEESKSEKDLLYPPETPDGASLPSATEVSLHVTSLSATIFEQASSGRASSGSAARNFSNDFFLRPDVDDPGSDDDDPFNLLEETIVDEEAVRSTQSQPNSASVLAQAAAAASSGSQGVFDEDEDMFLSELMAELGTGREEAGDVLSQASSRSRERQEEDEKDTAEMSQLWFEDDEADPEEPDGGGAKGEKEKGSGRKPSSDIWGDEDDDNFWSDVAKSGF